MDLKGYLLDTHLKIYPTEKLLDFLKTVPISDSLPHNILQIIKGVKGKFETYNIADQKPISFTSSDIENLNKIKKSCAGEKTAANECEEKSETENYTPKTNEEQSKDNNKNGNDEIDEKDNIYKESKNDNEIYLVTADLNWLYDYLKLRRSNGEKDIPYLHTLLEDAHIKLPENKTIKRNPDLEARCVKLRAQQEAREYRKMTKGVDNVRMKFPEDSISYQLKQLNRQLIAIGQFIISIFAGFLFGFRGVEWMVGNLDFGFRLLLGVMCALVIALAEIYFLAKKLNEELCIPETVQLGGPIKFADSSKNTVEKPHQD